MSSETAARELESYQLNAMKLSKLLDSKESELRVSSKDLVSSNFVSCASLMYFAYLVVYCQSFFLEHFIELSADCTQTQSRKDMLPIFLLKNYGQLWVYLKAQTFSCRNSLLENPFKFLI